MEESARVSQTHLLIHANTRSEHKSHARRFARSSYYSLTYRVQSSEFLRAKQQQRILTDHRIILYIRKIGGTGRAREQQRWLDGWYRSGQGPGVLGGGEGLRNRLI